MDKCEVDSDCASSCECKYCLEYIFTPSLAFTDPANARGRITPHNQNRLSEKKKPKFEANEVKRNVKTTDFSN